MAILKIVADYKIPFLQGVLESRAQMLYLPGNQIKPEHVRDADALIIRTRTGCNADLLKYSAVKYIASATIGYDHIDTQWCKQHNILWTNAPGCNAGSVVQYVASALAHISDRHPASLSQLTLGIIGAGNIGSRLASLANTLGMKVLINDPPRAAKEGNQQFTPLDELLEKSDIITLHIPLEKKPENNTFHLVDENFLARTKQGVWFINTSRGEVADSAAILKFIKNKHLAGTILDVWENEPHVDAELAHRATLSTPHIAGYSLDGKANGTAMCVNAVSRFFGLGMDNWYPENIPAPPCPVVSCNCLNKSHDEIFQSLSLKTYDIQSDAARLKESLKDFEALRENYPIRREAHAYTLNLQNCSRQNESFIRKLGYPGKSA